MRHRVNNSKEDVYTREVWPTCFRVPQFEIAIVGSTQELGPRVVEANVSHRFAVA